jgi:hypothetical protein
MFHGSNVLDVSIFYWIKSEMIAFFIPYGPHLNCVPLQTVFIVIPWKKVDKKLGYICN